MWLDFLFEWPDRLLACPSFRRHSAEAIAIQLRLQQHLSADQSLAVRVARQEASDPAAVAALSCYLALVRQEHARASAALQHLDSIDHAFIPFRNFLQVQLWLLQADVLAIPDFADGFWNQHTQWQPLVALRAAVAFLRGDLVEAQRCLDSVAKPPILEVVRQRAALYVRLRRFSEAVELLAGAVERFPQHLELQAQYVNTLLEARSQERTLPALRSALSLHGEHPRLLASVCTVKLLQRQPSLARRAAFVQRLWPDVARQDQGRLSNVLVTYEQTGHSDWLAHLSASALQDVAGQLAIQENLCLQLASIQSPLVVQQLQKVVDAYQQNNIADIYQPSIRISASPLRRLRIGWVSGDICHHPVARFVMGFFEATTRSAHHQHVLVNLRDHAAESYLDRFQRYSHLEHVDATQIDLSGKVRAIRHAQLDVAIDLSGWTGGHFMRGFLARFAPLQLNYLGYFASTGLPTMDAWIGDDGLFPIPMQEWHSEAIHRLNRCFIAWQPSQQLDEAHEPVTDAPSGGIRFGCFNHNRKLSDTVLRLWGNLLQSVPGSSLVLKANAASDPYTQTLLVRRMRRAGLDPERVIWLPLAPSHREHLQQYAQVDVALDSFPNGGCTTTCEALWMGVPVITLTGTHYVSRMSTAVLRGAGLPHLCAASPQHYLELACQQADRLSELRSNRDRWRNQVIHHPLGDAADLMLHLEQAFVSLHSTAVAQHASL